MTAQERPAGRPACGARPAGARDGRGTGISSTDPAVIRAALDFSDSHTYLATATRFQVSVRTVTRWRDRRDASAAAGERWPSDVDVEYWSQRQPDRAVGRRRQQAWERRRALAGGPLMVDAIGTTRRMRALAALGWRLKDLAEQLGVTDARVGHLTRGESPRVHRDTVAAVTALYDRLSMTPGPSARTRALAAARGWATPLSWDDGAIDVRGAQANRGHNLTRRGVAFDEVAVARAMRGDRVHLRPVERAAAVRRLTARGLSAAQIAERLHTTKRSVSRTRSTDTTRRSA